MPGMQTGNALLDGFCAEPEQAERIAVRACGGLLFLRLADIDWIEAVGGCVELHAGQESHLLGDTLESLIAKLPPDRFRRTSRSTIVNLNRVEETRATRYANAPMRWRNRLPMTLVRSCRSRLRGPGRL